MRNLRLVGEEFGPAAVCWPHVLVLGLSKGTPLSLMGFEGNAHLVELHDSGVGADCVSWPLGSNSDEVVFGFVA